MMHAKPWYRATMLAAVFPVAGAGSTAFGDETSVGVTILRGTSPVMQQPQGPQEVRVIPSPRPSCADGYVYSPLFGYCYRPRDPLNDWGY
jgi:hypothetical protein